MKNIQAHRSPLRQKISFVIFVALLGGAWTACKQKSEFAPAPQNDPELPVLGYVLHYSGDAHTTPDLSLLVLDDGARKTIAAPVTAANIGTVLTVLNAGTVAYKKNANIFIVTAKSAGNEPSAHR